MGTSCAKVVEGVREKPISGSRVIMFHPLNTAVGSDVHFGSNFIRTSANRLAEVVGKLLIRPHSDVQKVEYDHPGPTDGFFYDPYLLLQQNRIFGLVIVARGYIYKKHTAQTALTTKISDSKSAGAQSSDAVFLVSFSTGTVT